MIKLKNRLLGLVLVALSAAVLQELPAYAANLLTPGKPDSGLSSAVAGCSSSIRRPDLLSCPQVEAFAFSPEVGLKPLILELKKATGLSFSLSGILPARIEIGSRMTYASALEVENEGSVDQGRYQKALQLLSDRSKVLSGLGASVWVAKSVSLQPYFESAAVALVDLQTGNVQVIRFDDAQP